MKLLPCIPKDPKKKSYFNPTKRSHSSLFLLLPPPNFSLRSLNSLLPRLPLNQSPFLVTPSSVATTTIIPNKCGWFLLTSNFPFLETLSLPCNAHIKMLWLILPKLQSQHLYFILLCLILQFKSQVSQTQKSLSSSSPPPPPQISFVSSSSSLLATFLTLR